MNFYLLAALLCFSCTRADFKESQLSGTAADLEGHWKLHDVEIVDQVPFLNLRATKPDPTNRVCEDSPWDSYTRHDLVFEHDSMYMVDYPIQAYTPVHYFLDTGYLHVGPKDDIYAYPAALINDTLLLYRPLRSDPGFFKETYVRTHFNDSVLSIMKKYGINYPELAGTWILVREEDYDDGTQYELLFPHTLPDSIEFSQAQMTAALEGMNTFKMTTDGIKRDYSFYYRESRMYFQPGQWYKKGDDPLIYFYRKQNE